MKRFSYSVLLLLICLTTSVSGATSPHISIDVHDADLTQVLTLLSSESGVNVITDASVKPQRVTLHLRDVSFDQALSVLIQSHGLQVRRQGNVLIVGAAESMNRRYGDSSDSGSARTVVLTLRHASPDDVAKELESGLAEGTVIVSDRRTNTIIVTGSAETVERAHELIAVLDAPAYRNNAGNIAHSYPLRFVRPSDIGKELKGALPDGSYVVDDAQNAIVVTGNEEIQNTAAQFLHSIDVATPQVMFEVRVADVQPVDENSNVGIQLGGVDFGGQPMDGGTTYTF
ncbi:MAG: secretin and TonB N-terminal domain-containing protein, partial [Candidatus Eremiobacteraeota bacterium]|nr:secretin and TonB N-terminal domain-containing protein [Candidatus Eremiobacteraeota bacterium]